MEMKFIVWGAMLAATVRTTSVAGLKLLLPARLAVKVQSVVPLVIVTVSMPPLMVQPPVATIVTVRPESDVALTEKVVPNIAGDVGWAKVINWFALPRVMVCETWGAAL